MYIFPAKLDTVWEDAKVDCFFNRAKKWVKMVTLSHFVYDTEELQDISQSCWRIAKLLSLF